MSSSVINSSLKISFAVLLSTTTLTAKFQFLEQSFKKILVWFGATENSAAN